MAEFAGEKESALDQLTGVEADVDATIAELAEKARSRLAGDIEDVEKRKLEASQAAGEAIAQFERDAERVEQEVEAIRDSAARSGADAYRRALARPKAADYPSRSTTAHEVGSTLTSRCRARTRWFSGHSFG